MFEARRFIPTDDADSIHPFFTLRGRSTRDPKGGNRAKFSSPVLNRAQVNARQFTSEPALTAHCDAREKKLTIALRLAATVRPRSHEGAQEKMVLRGQWIV